MGWLDRFKKRKQVTITPNAPKEHVFAIGDLDISVIELRNANGGAEVIIRGG